MSRVDTAWLRMDNDVNLMMIVGVWLLHAGDRLRAALPARRGEAAAATSAFASASSATRPARTGATTPTSTSTITSCARSSCAQAGQSERAALQERVGALASEPLDPARPLWQFHLIEGYEGGSALIARVHHCIGDGIALISVMMTITDGGSDPPRRAAPRQRRRRRRRLARRRRAEAARRPLGQGGGAGRGGDRARARRPRRSAAGHRRRDRRRARLGAKVLGDVAAMALMADDSPTLLKGKPSGDKRVAWGEPIALADVKAIGKALGGSINDVLLASRRRRDRRLAARPGRRSRGQGDPRHGAGQPAPARRGLAARQPLRPGAAGAADRHRQPGRARRSRCARA